MNVFACSGEKGAAAIADSIQLGYVHWGIDGGLLLVSLIMLAFVRQTSYVPAILLWLVLCHPAWTISATKGDCDWLKQVVSNAFTVFAIIGVGFQVIVAFASHRKKCEEFEDLLQSIKDSEVEL